MSKLISLTQGQYAIVDDEDFKELNKHRWCTYYNKNRDTYIAKRNSKKVNGKQKSILMAREIIGAKKGEYVDHKNHDTLDNRKCNLRICTHQQNDMNRLPDKNTSSKYKGVTWERKRWRVRITINGELIHLGCFHDEISAAKAYDKKAREAFGKFAYLNFGGKI